MAAQFAMSTAVAERLEKTKVKKKCIPGILDVKDLAESYNVEKSSRKNKHRRRSSGDIHLAQVMAVEFQEAIIEEILPPITEMIEGQEQKEGLRKRSGCSQPAVHALRNFVRRNSIDMLLDDKPRLAQSTSAIKLTDMTGYEPEGALGRRKSSADGGCDIKQFLRRNSIDPLTERKMGLPEKERCGSRENVIFTLGTQDEEHEDNNKSHIQSYGYEPENSLRRRSSVEPVIASDEKPLTEGEISQNHQTDDHSATIDTHDVVNQPLTPKASQGGRRERRTGLTGLAMVTHKTEHTTQVEASEEAEETTDVFAEEPSKLMRKPASKNRRPIRASSPALLTPSSLTALHQNRPNTLKISTDRQILGSTSSSGSEPEPVTSKPRPTRSSIASGSRTSPNHTKPTFSRRLSQPSITRVNSSHQIRGSNQKGKKLHLVQSQPAINSQIVSPSTPSGRQKYRANQNISHNNVTRYWDWYTLNASYSWKSFNTSKVYGY